MKTDTFRAFLGILLSLVGNLVLASNALAAPDPIRQSVVRIHTTVRLPHPFNPWTKQGVRELTGSGVVIEGNRILTNAHVVGYAQQVYVQGYQSADKLPAKVVGIAPGIDLALLKLEDESFFKDRIALPLSDELPKVRDKINAYGYPTGGDELSVTEGIVSRIEMASYFDGVAGLRIQIDAALNPGNSGGPAISDGKVVGLGFSGLTEAENIGYVIPVEEIRTFLDDIADGQYDGKPRMRVDLQTCENDDLRAWLHLPADVTGMLVTRINGNAKDSALQTWDLITHVGEHAIDNEGQVRVRDDLRLYFVYYISKLAREGKVPLTVRRGNQTLKVDVPVRRNADMLIPALNNEYPRYFIYGPIVFTAVTSDFTMALGRGGLGMLAVAKSPIVTRALDRRAFEGEELVAVATNFLPHRITKGYGNPIGCVIDQVNGVKIKSLTHLVQTLRDAKEPFLEFKFAGLHGENLVFRRDQMLAATEDVLTDNGIRAQYSPDLRDLWEKP